MLIKDEERQLRKAALKAAPAELKRRGIPYVPKMNGRFEIRLKGRSSIDFFPSTGNWRVRGSYKEGNGYDSLEAHYKSMGI